VAHFHGFGRVRKPSGSLCARLSNAAYNAQIIEVLLEERPEDILRAYEALANRRSMLRAVNTKIRSLPDVSSDRIQRLLGAR
jgi:hypothetical protein